MGARRVEQYKLSSLLEEVAWVFSSLCVGVPQEQVDAGLPSWDGASCAKLVCNLGLQQYAESIRFNLTGAKLPELQLRSFGDLGVHDFDHQKKILAAVRSLIDAYGRRHR
eukprot:3545994-Prymnesium_polylepis.1